MAKISASNKWKQSMEETIIFKKRGFFYVDPTEMGFFDAIINADLHMEDVRLSNLAEELREITKDLKAQQATLKPFWKPTCGWESLKRILFSDCRIMPHSVEWFKTYGNARWNTGEEVYQVHLGNEQQYHLLLIWLVNNWHKSRDLPVKDAVKLLLGNGKKVYGEGWSEAERNALGKEDILSAIVLEDSKGKGGYFANLYTALNIRQTVYIIHLPRVEFFEDRNELRRGYPWLVLEL